MIVILDNYDSFTYNLYQAIGMINPDILVIRNDKVAVEALREMCPSHLIISPGPGFPKNAGISVSAIKELAGFVPILGVCLGHQAIGEAFGGKIVHAPHLVHGKSSLISLSQSILFQGLPETISVGRYHSLIVQKEQLPVHLRITAETKEGEIMAVEHMECPVFGLQFHPESILTPEGDKILRNFLAVSMTRYEVAGMGREIHV